MKETSRKRIMVMSSLNVQISTDQLRNRMAVRGWEGLLPRPHPFLQHQVSGQILKDDVKVFASS
jgi:hypothetical protein